MSEWTLSEARSALLGVEQLLDRLHQLDAEFNELAESASASIVRIRRRRAELVQWEQEAVELRAHFRQIATTIALDEDALVATDEGGRSFPVGALPAGTTWVEIVPEVGRDPAGGQ